jgi:hypothetical protein
MQEEDFPALYRSADELSRESQNAFLRVLKAHLCALVTAAILSIVAVKGWETDIAMLQLGVLLVALACSIYLFAKKPDRHWYAGRAVAESLKTITWRYVCRAEPFEGPNDAARASFNATLKEIIVQNREVSQSLDRHLGGPQITAIMEAMRGESIDVRRETYAKSRIDDQRAWYAKKASFNRRMSRGFFWGLIVVNCFAVACAVLRIKYPTTPFWPTDVLVAGAASLLSWMQAKRYSELAASYSLTAHEIGFIAAQARQPMPEHDFSIFVGDAENAFSREHTQWIARKDV